MFSGVVSSVNDQDAKSWNELFSSLAFAEKAAADECVKISNHFEKIGLSTLATKYKELAVEENLHHRLALSITKEVTPLTKRAQEIYNGDYFTNDGPILEHLMTLHLVFEPAALAFLGHVSSHAQEIGFDELWSKQIKSAFNQILLDEVDHVYSGEKLIRQFWNRASVHEKHTALKTMRKHRAFLKAGLRSFFKKETSNTLAINKMLSRFDFYFNKALKGAIDEQAA